MAYEISFVDNADTVLAMCKMVDRVKTLALANGWTALRDVTATDSREVILKGVGLTGLEEIYVGLKTYYNSGSDYYNILVGGFTGYVSGNTFETQPNAYLSGVPAHNNRIDYWLVVNTQRIVCAMKVGTPVYESFYVGKIFPYGRPSQYPYPLLVSGALTGAAPTRFSDTVHQFCVRGAAQARMALRNNEGWILPYANPYDNTTLAGATASIRDTNGKYHLMQIELYQTGGLYGVMDGCYHITGFNNTVENTVVIGGVTHVVIQNVWRTGFPDYFALRLE